MYQEQEPRYYAGACSAITLTPPSRALEHAMPASQATYDSSKISQGFDSAAMPSAYSPDATSASTRGLPLPSPCLQLAANPLFNADIDPISTGPHSASGLSNIASHPLRMSGSLGHSASAQSSGHYHSRTPPAVGAAAAEESSDAASAATAPAASTLPIRALADITPQSEQALVQRDAYPDASSESTPVSSVTSNLSKIPRRGKKSTAAAKQSSQQSAAESASKSSMSMPLQSKQPRTSDVQDENAASEAHGAASAVSGVIMQSLVTRWCC